MVTWRGSRGEQGDLRRDHYGLEETQRETARDLVGGNRGSLSRARTGRKGVYVSGLVPNRGLRDAPPRGMLPVVLSRHKKLLGVLLT